MDNGEEVVGRAHVTEDVVTKEEGKQGCLFAVLWAEPEEQDALVRAAVAPLAARLSGDPQLQSFFFVRFDKPRWHLRVRALGPPSWIEARARPIFEERLAAFDPQWAEYEREVDRYGGDDGLSLAERLFLADTLATLRRFADEERDVAVGTRREHHLLRSEDWLDQLDLHGQRRRAVYRGGYAWAIDSGDWSEADLELLEARLAVLRPGLRRLLDARAPEPVDAIASIRAAAETGRLERPLEELAVSYLHMAANRLGITPTAEAILRFFMDRLESDR